MLHAGPILETVIYADDLASTALFYERVLGLQYMDGDHDLLEVFRIAPGSVLLIFNPEQSEAPGRSVPVHGARGPGHIALRIEPGRYEAWVDRLGEMAVPIEQEHTWPDGNRSIYVRDPAGNCVELITGDIWPGA